MLIFASINYSNDLKKKLTQGKVLLWSFFNTASPIFPRRNNFAEFFFQIDVSVYFHPNFTNRLSSGN